MTSKTKKTWRVVALHDRLPKLFAVIPQIVKAGSDYISVVRTSAAGEPEGEWLAKDEYEEVRSAGQLIPITPSWRWLPHSRAFGVGPKLRAKAFLHLFLQDALLQKQEHKNCAFYQIRNDDELTQYRRAFSYGLLNEARRLERKYPETAKNRAVEALVVDPENVRANAQVVHLLRQQAKQKEIEAASWYNAAIKRGIEKAVIDAQLAKLLEENENGDR